MLNQVSLMGRLVRNPETRYLQSSDSSVTRFTIAVERNYKAQNEDKPKADFINCTAWNKKGEFIAKYFPKGSMIAITGSIETGSYLDNDTGKTVYTTEVRVSEAYFTGEKREQQTGSSHADSDGFMNVPDGIDEELPFN
ncbi:MAG: single-stranded DNA-binding protein [Lachnospiraceae bacterium]|nr:single-stranded DNA-binding protein [Lachnospiraceae bacterium]